ncbi:hypothetical protein TWF506_000825 [Arthrobotrys conoides]|uniref:F-box domain-containing protein n=1 Tax=Arthrobotrys conoides TaxID=74498 RepID=A0AAN8PR93_9PEZI
MSSLGNLIPELLNSILFYLPTNDILSLLRTNKYLHSVCLPYIWFKLTLYDNSTPDDYEFSIYNPLIKRRLWRLVETTDEFGVDALGYKFIKKLKILAPEVTLSIENRTVENGFQKLLGDLIESGKISLREVSLRDSNRYPIPPDVSFGLLHQIKKYSESKSPSEFSMKVQTEKLPPFVQTGALNPSVLTKLQLTLHLQSATFSEAWERYHGTLSIQVKDNILEEIEALTQLLSGAVNLKELWIQPETNGYEPGPISELTEPLQNLQTAFDGLKRLRQLTIGSDEYSTGSAIFFHPSFFVAPPENCKVLQYGSTVSIGWWRKFAAHPLTKVEDLTLCLSPMTLLSRRWIDAKEDEEALEPDLSSQGQTDRKTKLYIGDVAVRGLKVFTVGTAYYENLVANPRDLEACIYRRNKGLDEAHELKLRDEVISEVHSQMMEGFSVGMARCARHIATRHFEDWIKRNAIEDATAEKCLEELNLEKEKHVVEFTKMLSSWANRNIDKFHFRVKEMPEFESLDDFIEGD